MTWTPGLYTWYARGQGEGRETKVAWGVVGRADQLVGLEPGWSGTIGGSGLVWDSGTVNRPIWRHTLGNPKLG